MAVGEHQAPWYKISRCMLPCKAIYFFQLSKEVSFRMNLVLFLTSIGLSKSQAGLVVGIRLLSVLVAAPLFGMIADKFNIHRIIITLCSLVAIMGSSSQPLLAYIYGPTRFLYCDSGSDKSEKKTTFNRNAFNTSSNLTETVTENIFEGVDINRLFWIMFAINIFQSLFDGALDGFIDAGVMVRLKQRNEKPGSSRHQYGTQRVLGVLGQVVSPILVNYAIDYFPSRRVTCYTGLFVAYAMMQLMYMLCMLWLFQGLDFSHDNDDKIIGDEEDQEMLERKQSENNEIKSSVVPNKETFKDAFRKTFFEEEMLMMFFVLFIAGVLLCEIVTYSFPYMKDLRATTMDLNVFLILFSVGSLIGFLLCHRIIRMCGGPFQALTLTVCSYVIRFIIMASTNSPLVVSISQILSMFDLPITESVSLEFAMRKSPKIVLTSLMGLMNAVQYSLSDVIGGTLGGFMYELYDGEVLFYGCSVIAAIVAIVVSAWLLIGKYCRHITEEENNIKQEA